ncbi:MAG: BamA/TamA family outer membrane protein [Bacteroidota bacterium]
MRHLIIEQNEVFDQRQVDRIQDRLQTLPFVELTDSVRVRFRYDRAYVELPLRTPPSSQFDALIGFLPNEAEGQRLLLTGRAEIDLKNPFGRGRQIALSWQRIRAETQQLNLAFEQPSVFGTRLTPRFELDWLKEDTTFFSLRQYLRVSYPTKQGSFGGIVERKMTRLLAAPNSGRSNEIDGNLWNYGVSWSGNRTDRFFQPRKGWRWHLEAKIGDKQVQDRSGLSDNFLDSLAQRTTQIELRLDLRRYLRMGRLTTLVLRTQGGMLLNEQLFRNDLFRMGGLRSLRGFNENFFFASQYAVQTVETRLQIDQDSYLFAFWDQAAYTFETLEDRRDDFPFGVGVGLQFTTKSGVFSFVYAMGRSAEQTLGLNTAKIHFGFVSRF